VSARPMRLSGPMLYGSVLPPLSKAGKAEDVASLTLPEMLDVARSAPANGQAIQRSRQGPEAKKDAPAIKATPTSLASGQRAATRAQCCR